MPEIKAKCIPKICRLAAKFLKPDGCKLPVKAGQAGGTFGILQDSDINANDFVLNSASSNPQGNTLSADPASLSFGNVARGDLTAPFRKTNGFGNYIFEGLTAGQIYVVSVAAKRYTFTQSSIVLNVGDNIVGADFEAEDR